MDKIAKFFIRCWPTPFMVKADAEKRNLLPKKICFAYR